MEQREINFSPTIKTRFLQISIVVLSTVAVLYAFYWLYLFVSSPLDPSHWGYNKNDRNFIFFSHRSFIPFFVGLPQICTMYNFFRYDKIVYVTLMWGFITGLLVYDRILFLSPIPLALLCYFYFQSVRHATVLR